MSWYDEDTRGVELAVGQKVAYNLSGAVAFGRVVGLPRRGGRGAYKVELLHRACGLAAGHVSKVKNSTSILVIDHRHDTGDDA